MPIKHVSGPTIEQIIKNLDVQKKSIQTKVINLADQTTEYMRSQIKPRRAGSTGNLENSIEAVVSVQADTVTAGVAVNEKKAPYWAIINYGGLTPPTGGGGFTGTGGRKPKPGIDGTQRWKPGFGNYSLVPNKPIAPMNYVEKTQIWLNRKIKSIFK